MRATEHRMAWFTLTDNYSLISKEVKYSKEPPQAYSCLQLLLTPLQSWAKYYQQITTSAFVLTRLLNQDNSAIQAKFTITEK